MISVSTETALPKRIPFQTGRAFSGNLSRADNKKKILERHSNKSAVPAEAAFIHIRPIPPIKHKQNRI
jgi:hypothetical protein